MVVALMACSGGPDATRFRESGLNSDFRYQGLPFAEYVQQMRTVIANARVDLKPESAARIVEDNSPFELQPAASCAKGKSHRTAKGILLVHGMLDSPFLMRDLGRYFQQRCFLVRAILLPGHGTVPGDLLRVNAEAWQQAMRYGVNGLAEAVDEVYLAGFSTGAALAVQTALQGEGLAGAPPPQPVRGMFLFSPALKIKTRFALLAGLVARFRPWLSIAPDEDRTKYESVAANAAAQVFDLTQQVYKARAGRALTVPMFVALSADDDTVDAREAIGYFRSVPNPANRMVLYGSSEAAQGDARIVEVPAARPQDRVLQFAHISIPIAPDNPHYGVHGDYRACLSYLKDAGALQECKTRPDISFGETGAGNPKGLVFARLTYNPDFAHMTQEMDRFLAGIGAR